jgi:hypothetical protein
VFRFERSQFIYNWQTSKGYFGTCRLLQVTLSDGAMHNAKFQFKLVFWFEHAEQGGAKGKVPGGIGP